MKKKLRQVTDGIEETIYLSSLESELISTPYFYRLHDIYQSSTVYMTFPSNRTKRYEHSLGTMEIASSILFSAVSNADKKVKEILFKELRIHFEKILDLAIFQTEDQVAQYFVHNKDKIDDLFDNIGSSYGDAEKIIKENITKAMKADCFIDSALDYFQFYPTGIDGELDTSVLDMFLYRCLLQAIRIVALFHDVGHPPYSHIIEEVLNKLYDKCTTDQEFIKRCNEQKMKDFIKHLTPYKSKIKSKSYKCNTLYSESSLVDAQLHERIGLNLMQSAINDVMIDLMKRVIDSTKIDECKRASTIYYIMVIEFATAILVEKNNFFKSFHKIVDGILDADRFDYIMRDSLNSGVDWGKIPYKRLINSAKLINLEKEDVSFAIAYPDKLIDDIEDVLLLRYKIFARINYHHRCMKTATSLQDSVLYLAENYLTMDDTQCINPEINMLWTVLTKSAGNKKIRIIQWNDSWLISALHKALVNLEMSKSIKHKMLKENLEEILLNKKRYFSLFKRGKDIQDFIDKIYDHLGLTDEILNDLKLAELIKYLNNHKKDGEIKEIFNNPECDAMDSINRISHFIDAKKENDLKTLCEMIPLDALETSSTDKKEYTIDEEIYQLVDDVLERLKKDNVIVDSLIYINNGREKTGMPKATSNDYFDKIYLYHDKEHYCYDVRNSLLPRILKIKSSIPWLYVYYVPFKENDEDDMDTYNVIFEELAKEVADRLGKRYKELFENFIK